MKRLLKSGFFLFPIIIRLASVCLFRKNDRKGLFRIYGVSSCKYGIYPLNINNSEGTIRLLGGSPFSCL